MMGPPGTGKTLLARAIAGEAGVPFFSISGSDFVEMFVGVGASRVRDLFEQGKKNAPCIIFIDEIDAVGRHRGAGLGGGHDEREQTLNQLLVEMDGFESNEGVILIAATNRPGRARPGAAAPRALRPPHRRAAAGRAWPDRHPRGAHQEDAARAGRRPGRDRARHARASRAPISRTWSTRRRCWRRATTRSQLDMSDFEMAKDKVLMGPERRSMIISDSDKRVTAYHEAGHALVGKMMKGSDPVHKVTIIPRGRALGLTQQLPAEDRLNLSLDSANDQIAVAMGGRVAEELIFHQLTTGASNDIQVATDLARKMVCDWGMSEKLGPLHFGKREGEVFLGRDFGDSTKEYSEETAVEIDGEVRKIVTANYERAKKAVVDNVDKLKALAEALLEYETVDGAEIDQIFAGKRLNRTLAPTAPSRASEPKAAEKARPASSRRPPVPTRPSRSAPQARSAPPAARAHLRLASCGRDRALSAGGVAPRRRRGVRLSARREQLPSAALVRGRSDPWPV